MLISARPTAEVYSVFVTISSTVCPRSRTYLGCPLPCSDIIEYLSISFFLLRYSQRKSGSPADTYHDIAILPTHPQRYAELCSLGRMSNDQVVHDICQLC